MESRSQNVYINDEMRTIYLVGEINEETMAAVNSSLIQWEQEDGVMDSKIKDYEPDPVSIFLDSPGGSVYAGLSIIATMRTVSMPIITYCSGYAFSMAFAIFINGDYRYCSPYSTFMYHQISESGGTRTYQDKQESIDEDNFLMHQLETMVLEKTEIPESKLVEVREKKQDYFIHGMEAVNLGIADDIIEDYKAAERLEFDEDEDEEIDSEKIGKLLTLVNTLSDEQIDELLELAEEEQGE